MGMAPPLNTNTLPEWCLVRHYWLKRYSVKYNLNKPFIFPAGLANKRSSRCGPGQGLLWAIMNVLNEMKIIFLVILPPRDTN